MKIVISGGHLTPALAVISELKKRNLNDIFFIGRAKATEGETTPSAESTIIPNLGIKFYAIPVGRLQRRFTRYTIPSLLKSPIGVGNSMLILSQERPDLVISFGSYVALPVIIAAWVLGIPSITHEQTVMGGLANKIIARLAKRIALSWPDSLELFPKSKSVVTGIPIRAEILDAEKKRTSRPLVFITGGNQGAHSINETILEIIEPLLEKYEVVHQTGGSETFRDYEMLMAKVSQLPRKLQSRYQAFKWLNSKDLADVYARTSLVVGRSGANTVSEVAALGLPALFIPLPWSGANEQEKNALMLQNLGGALVLTQERLTPKRLLAAINSMIINLNKYKMNSKAAKKMINPEAAKLFVDEAIKLARSKYEV
ncbi:UDP-N-acetylglucosamine--N-acetylmuramyl-(pentapeptide) pyrophosphoryl-undecaprenol N-acetylglucosamine transferase [Patescibacteria group bacterium]|nr:UDP-N-acetylglucosamine--N-acetylmuramyl-(pentapeptide) pyrophosphoryl-undecaprenol N-acetylglucosamine transferase [Patescibacteria group bacterium]